MFSLVCAWIIGWVNDREAGDLRLRRAHYDVMNDFMIPFPLAKGSGQYLSAIGVSPSLTTPYSAWNFVNIGSGNGWLPDGTKPLLEAMHAYTQRSPVAFASGESRTKFTKYQFPK